MSQVRVVTEEEVGRHASEGDAWVVVDGEVFDVSKFARLHPGGKQVLMQYAGKDASDVFHQYHPPSVLRKYRTSLLVGQLPDAQERKKKPLRPESAFGDMIPYGDPLWYQRFNSPYYKDTHKEWRAKVRQFTEAEIIPTMDEWKDKPVPPRDIYEKMGQLGFLAVMVGPPWPAEFLPPTVVPPRDLDYFHVLILFDELARCGHAGVVGGLTNGPSIALTAVLKFGSEELKRRVAPDVLLGRKFIALAVSEPHIGSDVARMLTTAKREGDTYVVNGNKKWITNGTYADYFVTAVRTGGAGSGQKGLSFMVIEKATPGFSVRKLNIRGSDITGTAYLDFDNCRVPARNLIGKENDGFKMVMYNFNHERFYVVALALRMARVCLEESIKYAMRRETFGKRLYEHQSIRMKIASMIRRVESLQAWLETVVYQMCTMGHREANEKLGDVISLLKAESSKVYELVARETTMVFGGQALYQGVGKKIEGAVTQVKGYQIPAGAEDIMDDFGARMAFKRAVLMANL